MRNRLKINKNKLKIIGVILLILTLPLILSTLYVIQNTRSSAAAPDKLEAEAGVLSSTGVTKQNDSGASGGQFVVFNRGLGATPTFSPNPTIPTNAVYVPNSIDSTGTTDVYSQLQTFVNNTPDGSTIVFKQGATYQISQRIRMIGRNGLTFEGNGATLKHSGGTGAYKGGSITIDSQSENIYIRNLTISGNHTQAGTADACCSRESEHAFGIYGSTNIQIDNVDISRIGGDCFYFSGSGNEFIWPDGVEIRNSKCSLTGRSGVNIDAGKNILVENNYFDKIAYCFVNIEPNGSDGGAINISIRNNQVGSWGLTNIFATYFFAACDAPWGGGSIVRNIIISENTAKGNIHGYYRKMVTLNSLICGNDGIREDISFTNNIGKSEIDGGKFGVLEFLYVNGLTVTGNVQTYTGRYVNFSGSTSITTDISH